MLFRRLGDKRLFVVADPGPHLFQPIGRRVVFALDNDFRDTATDGLLQRKIVAGMTLGAVKG